MEPEVDQSVEDDRVSLRSIESLREYDNELIDSSLANLNPFLAKRLAEKNQDVLILSISPSGDSEYKNISLRHLLAEINALMGESVREDKTRYAVSEIHYRDLRRLDYQLNPVENPAIIVRRNCVLMILDPLRCIIMANKVIMVVPDGADTLLEILEKHMQSWALTRRSTSAAKDAPGIPLVQSDPALTEKDKKATKRSSISKLFSNVRRATRTPSPTIRRPVVEHIEDTANIGLDLTYDSGPADSGADAAAHKVQHHGKGLTRRHSKSFLHDKVEETITFEYHAYEAILTTAIAVIKQDYNKVKAVADELLPVLHAGGIIPFEAQKDMADLKGMVSEALSHCLAHKKCIMDALEDDESMALMSITTLKLNPMLYNSPLSMEILATHEEMEAILESNLMDCSLLLSNIEAVKNNIQHTEELVAMQLDCSLNQLLRLDTCISIFAAAVGTGGYIAGLFGMNLNNTIHLQTVPFVFQSVCWATAVLVTFGVMLVIKYFTVTGLLPAYNVEYKVKGRRKFGCLSY